MSIIAEYMFTLWPRCCTLRCNPSRNHDKTSTRMFLVTGVKWVNTLRYNSHTEILDSIENEQTTIPHSNADEPHKHNTQRNKPGTKGSYFTYIKFKNRLSNRWARNQMRGYLWWGGVVVVSEWEGHRGACVGANNVLFFYYMLGECVCPLCENSLY